MKALHPIAFILTIIGGLNWGLYGLGLLINNNGDWNVVHMVLQAWPQVEAIVYVLVGLSAIWLIIEHKKTCKNCSSGGMM